MYRCEPTEGDRCGFGSAFRGAGRSLARREIRAPGRRPDRDDRKGRRQGGL